MHFSGKRNLTLEKKVEKRNERRISLVSRNVRLQRISREKGFNLEEKKENNVVEE